MTKDTKIRLLGASLDDKGNEIVAHGWLDPEAIQHLRVGDYQREVLELRGGRKSSLRRALDVNERLPDIMLGMRGESYEPLRGGDMLLGNDVFIIDGLQRVSAIRKYVEDNPEKSKNVRIGAEIRFNTTRESEKDLFTILNVARKSMSASVILRNERNNYTGIATLYGLTNSDKDCAMYGKVCWNQQMNRGELLTALSFAKVCITLHRHAAPGGRHISTASVIPNTLETMSKATGLNNFRGNINAFCEFLDEVWGIRGIKYTDRATHTRNNFLFQMAGVLSDHEDFWTGNKLTVDANIKTKLKTFPIDDPGIIRLAGGGNAVGVLLYRHIVDHINKGKQASRHLVLRRPKESSNPAHFKFKNK